MHICRCFSKTGRMRFSRFFSDMPVIVLLAFFSFALASCNKEEEEEVSDMMIGDLLYDVPLYVKTGSTVELTAYGLTEPDESLINYVWTSEYLLQDTVREKVCEITVPDSIGTFALILTASSPGFYDRVNSQNVTSIDPEFGKTVTDMPRPTDSIQDPRDGQWYYITTVGNLDWFVESLNWCDAGAAYSKADDLGEIMGRLYTWNDATGGVSASGLGGGPQGVCPPGWSIPTNEDWEDLALNLNDGQALPYDSNWEGLGEMVMVDARFNGDRMWPYTPDCTPENKFGWAAFPSGYCVNDYDYHSGLFSYGFWWSSTEYTGGKASYRYIYMENPDFMRNAAGKGDFGASVRCVRLKQ